MFSFHFFLFFIFFSSFGKKLFDKKQKLILKWKRNRNVKRCKRKRKRRKEPKENDAKPKKCFLGKKVSAFFGCCVCARVCMRFCLLIAMWFVNWLENRCFPFKSILIKIGRFVKRNVPLVMLHCFWWLLFSLYLYYYIRTNLHWTFFIVQIPKLLKHLFNGIINIVRAEHKRQINKRISRSSERAHKTRSTQNENKHIS